MLPCMCAARPMFKISVCSLLSLIWSGGKSSGSCFCVCGVFFFFVVLCNHLRSGLLKAVWVHGGHEVDARVVDEVDDGLVALLVLVAQVLSQVDEQLSAHGLVAVHVGDVLKLRLTCRREQRDTCCVTASLSHTYTHRELIDKIKRHYAYNLVNGSEGPHTHTQPFNTGSTHSSGDEHTESSAERLN